LKKKLLNIGKYLGFLALGIFLFWLSFRKIDISLIWHELSEANYLWAFVALLIAGLSHVFRAMRWNLMIESMGYTTRLSTTFFAVMIGYLANTAVPRMGEFMRCGVLTKKDKIPFNTLFGTVISERLFDMLVLLILMTTVIFGQWTRLGDFVMQWIRPFVATIGSQAVWLLVLVVIALIVIAIGLFFYLTRRKQLNRFPGYKKMYALISGFAQGVKTITQVRQKGLFLLYTLLIWLSYALMVYIPFFMFPETDTLSPMAGVTLLALGSLGMVAPVPGGIGAYHFITNSVLTSLYGISAHIAGSFAVITHAGQTLLNVIVGSVGYLILFLKGTNTTKND